MYKPPYYDEKTGFILPFMDKLGVVNQTGSSCTFYATYIGVVIPHYLKRGKTPPKTNPYLDWKEFITDRGVVENGELRTSTSFVEAIGYYKQIGYLPHDTIIFPRSYDEALELMQRDNSSILLVIKTYGSYSDNYNFIPDRPKGNHSVFQYGKEANFGHIQGSEGKNQHRFDGKGFVNSGGRFRIPRQYFDDKNWVLWFGVYADREKTLEEQWKELTPHYKSRYAFILRGIVDDPTTLEDNHTAKMFEEYIKSDPLTAPLYNAK